MKSPWTYVGSHASGRSTKAVGSRCALIARCVVGHHLDQIEARSRHTRPNRADRAAKDVGSLVVVHAEDLRQHERFPAIVAEPVQHIVQRNSIRSVVRCERSEAAASDRVVQYRGVASTPALSTTGVIDADTASDREEPTTGRTFGAVPVERADRPFVDLLREIISVACVTEVPAQLPHIALGLGDEAFERAAVAVPRIKQQSRQMVHRGNIVAAGNRFPGTFDLCFVERDERHIPEIACDDAHVLLSVAADDEATRHEQHTLDQHLDGCADCTSLAERLAVVDRRVRLRPAEPVPDLVMAVTSRVRPAVLGRGGWMRPGLAWVAVVLFAQNIVPLVFGETDGAETHLARHLGAFGVALAIGFAYVAWRPHRAFGMLPFVGALVVTMLASTGFDLADGGRSAVAEATHLAELAGLALLWMIAGSPGWNGWADMRDRIGDRLHLSH